MNTLTIRLRRLLGELAYAQNRTLELRTGVALTRPRGLPRRARRRVRELELLWQLPARPQPDAGRRPTRPCARAGQSPPA